jgi:hypothetical protein
MKIFAISKQFMERNKRILEEVAEIQLQMARENPKPYSPLIFPNRPNKTSTVIVFWVVAVSLSTLCWYLMQRGH